MKLALGLAATGLCLALGAWATPAHAGLSSWQGRERCNDYSIGVELEGTDERPYTARQYRRLAALVRRLAARWPIVDVAGHSDVAPGRKTDPGPSFDWARLRALLERRERPVPPSMRVATAPGGRAT